LIVISRLMRFLSINLNHFIQLKPKTFSLLFLAFFLPMQGTQKVEGLILNLQSKGRDSFSTNVFQLMQNMRLLQLDCVDLTGDFGHLSKQLRWVNWQRSTLSCIPNDFYQGNLVVLELKFSNVKQVWKETKV